MMREFLREALREDWGRGDLFERVVRESIGETLQSKEREAVILAKSQGIFSGGLYLRELCLMCGLGYEAFCRDGESFARGEILGKISGDYIEVLKIERLALNLLQHSSGIATETRAWVQELEGLETRLLDTRKTRPLLREFEKYSVRNGGACNHRFGLDDALMLKDTHLACIQDLSAFIRSARSKLPFGAKIEVECESFDACQRAFQACVDIVMCDNMEPQAIQEVVQVRNALYPHILLEASGNLTRDNLRSYALTGVDALSSGSLIHQATWLDLSLKIRPFGEG